MKILKDTKTALLLKSFLLDNKDYLSVSVLCYFDLNNPNIPLEEQAMYRETKPLLGKRLLDYAMPKPQAEVLLCGACYNPLPQSGASHVRLKVGENIEKELYVFGERRWENGLITTPLSFERMPLDYAHAVSHGDLLPYVEDPGALTVSREEKKKPASFMPIDIFSDENRKKLGTFGGSYKRDRWPGFAADMDYRFFNVAPEEQRQEKFFKGGEAIALLHMHPKKALLTSHIPEISFKCFATIVREKEEDLFKEIKLQRDTLWLFPEIERGVIIFHGTLEVADEIYSDLRYLNVKPVFPQEPTKDLDDYYALQKKELNKRVEIDETPFEEAEKKRVEAGKELFDIPRQIKEGVEKTQGKRPTLKRTLAEKVEQGHKQIDEALVRIERSKVKLYEMKAEFGHINKIDTASLDHAKEKLLQSKVQLSKSMSEIEKTLSNAEAMKGEARVEIEKMKNDPHIPDELKAEIDTRFLEPKEKHWHDYAFAFLCECVKNVEKMPEVLHKLRHLGLAKRTIERNWIGFNPEEKRFAATEWKLEEDMQIVLPKGFVTARFEEATLKALRIEGRPIVGSDETYALFLSEENPAFPLFYLKDEREAYLCDQEAFDICNVLVCDDISQAGEGAKAALEKASVIFYLQKDGSIETLPHSRKFDCRQYENLFALYQNGIEIRDQIVQNLPQGVADELPIERDLSAKAIMERSRNITDKVKSDLKAKGEVLRKVLEKERDEAFEKANKILKEKGLEPIVQEPYTPSEGFIKPSEVAQHFDQAIEMLKQRDGIYNMTFQEKIAELEVEKEKMVALAVKGEKQYNEGMAKIAAAKEKAKDPIPDWAKKMMEKAGIDPNNPHPPALTREEVVERYEKGETFKGKNLSGLDLSHLDLHGIDLTQANCKGTDFAHSNLGGANLEQTNCGEANFTHSNLSDALANMTLFQKAIFEKTVFGAIEATQAFFDSVTLKDAIFEGAKLEGTLFKKATLENTVLHRCNISNISFIDATLNTSDFSYSQIAKALFSESTVEGCSFAGIDSKAMLFNQTKVVKCDFSSANLYNMRVLKQSSFTTCNLSHAKIQKSTLFEVKLDGCLFQKADLSQSMIKKSTLKKCDFRGAVAKGSRLEYAKCETCSFVGIDLLRGSLRRMDLKVCDFSYANLYGVEFYKTKFYEVKLKGANLKRSSLEKREALIYD